MFVEIFDNQISNVEEIYEELCSCPYKFGRRTGVLDKTDPKGETSPYDGMNSMLGVHTKTLNALTKFASTKKLLKEMILYKAQVNCLSPNENASHFHQDGEGLTFLYYGNPTFDYNEGGGTELIIGTKTKPDIRVVAPVPGRIIVFDGLIQHRSTPMKTVHRFVVALKFRPKWKGKFSSGVMTANGFVYSHSHSSNYGDTLK